MKLRCYFLLPLLSVSLQAASSEVIFDEQFADGEVETQQLPSSLQWFRSSLNNELVAEKGAVILHANHTDAYTGGQLQAFFAPDGTSITLDIGETLELKVVFQVTAPESVQCGLRFGLFDFRDPRAAGEGRLAMLKEARGYALLVNPRSPAAIGTIIAKRMPGDKPQPLLANMEPLLRLAERLPAMAFSEGRSYEAVFRVTRIAEDQVQLSYTLGGEGGSDLVESENIIDGEDPVTAFDAIGLTISTKVGEEGAQIPSVQALKVSQVKVSRISK